MRISFTQTLLAAVAAAAVSATATGALLTSPPAAEGVAASLSWLADAIDFGDADVQIFTVDGSGGSVEVSGEFREQILSFVSDALRSGTLNGSVTASVTVLDGEGNVLYSGDELPANLDELIGLLAN